MGKTDFKSYEQLEAEVEKLYEQEQYADAITLLESVSGQFPDNRHSVTWWLGMLSGLAGQHEKAFDIWEDGQKRGWFYGDVLKMPEYKPLEQFGRFEKILAEDKRLWDAALAKSEMKYEVVTPPGYSVDESYPLFVVLHGGHRTIAKARPYWHSPQLDDGYLVAFIQSYLHQNMDYFGWKRNDPRSRQGIADFFEEIAGRYRVDRSRVLIGGISAGGMMSIEVAIDNVIPASGFVGVCPVKPGEETFNAENVLEAKKRGQRGVLIAGENDERYLPYAQEMAEIFEQTGFPHEFEIVSGLGHDYPEDFPARLDAALEYLA